MPELLLVGSNDRPLTTIAPFLERNEPEWAIRQVANGSAAEEYIQRRKPEVVLAALGNDADPYETLFRNVAEQSPGTIRLALYDKSIGLPPKMPCAHQVMATRDEYEQLRPILTAAVEVSQRARQHVQLQKIICNLEDVPSPPTLYFDIREQLDSPDGNLERIATLVARDPSLVARVLRIVNSGFYAMPRSISDIGQAIGLIGADALLGLVLAAHLYSGLPPPGLKLELLWQHSIHVSAMARQITRLESGDRNAQSQSAVAGLLHDIGLMVLLENEPARYQPLWQKSHGDEAVLATLEREAFGITHGELGAVILMLWSLPAEVVEAVAHSHAPAEMFPCDPAELSIVSRSVLAGEWLIDRARDADVPAALQGASEDTLNRWRAIRDGVDTAGT